MQEPTARSPVGFRLGRWAVFLAIFVVCWVASRSGFAGIVGAMLVAAPISQRILRDRAVAPWAQPSVALLNLWMALPFALFSYMWLLSMWLGGGARIPAGAWPLFATVTGASLLATALGFKASSRLTSASLTMATFFAIKFLEGQILPGVLVSDTDWALPSSVAAAGVLSTFTWNGVDRLIKSRVPAVRPYEVALMSALPFASSYFWSGFGKLSFLWTDNFFWPLENRTDLLVLNAMISGTSPLTLVSNEIGVGLVSTFRDLGLFVALNFVAWLGQLLAPLILLSKLPKAARSAVFLVLELQHIGILLFTGIFFWKWMLVMLVIGFYLLRAGEVEPPEETVGEVDSTLVRTSAFAVVACFAATPLLHLPALAWIDSPLMFRVEAVASGGKVVAKSSLFPFDIVSLQSRELEGELASAFGAVRSRTDLEMANDICASADEEFSDSISEVWPALAPENMGLWAWADQFGQRSLTYAELLYPHHIVQPGISRFHRSAWGVRFLQPLGPVAPGLQAFVVVTCSD